MNSLFNKQQISGFGMLDALIGIFILSLVGVSSHTTMMTGLQSTDKIQKKLVASWVAENRITELKLAVRYLGQMDLEEQDITLAGFDWLTEAVIEKTTSSLVRVKVNVMEDNDTQAIIYSLSTYFPAEFLP